MKRAFIISALLSLLGLASCSKPEKAIVGEWEATSMEMSISGISMTINMDEAKMKLVYRFEKDGTGSIFTEKEGDSESISFDYTVDGNMLSLNDGDGLQNIPIFIDGKTMTLELNGENIGFDAATVKVHFTKL